MIGAGWSVENKRVVWSDAQGRVHTASAAEVFAAEFEPSDPIAARFGRRPSDDISGLRFSGVFASISYALSKSPNGRLRMQAFIEGSTEALQSLPDGDQVVHGDVWWPLGDALSSSVSQELQDRRVQLNEALTPDQAMWLIWRSGLGINIDFDSKDLSASAEPDIDDRFEQSLLAATPFPYQAKGMSLLSRMVDAGLGSLLADEMGLGKTLQALYVIARNAVMDSGPSLVVAPASTIANWERETSRFAPTVSYLSHVGAGRTGDYRVLDMVDCVFTTYETLARDSGMFDQIEWATVLLDEAQMIKNPSSRRADAVKALRRKSSIAITGTPIENSLRDLWSIMDFVLPDYLGDLSRFKDRYPDEASAAEQLSRRVSPITIRRRTAEVATDLPPRVDSLVPIYLSDSAIEAYEVLRAEERDALAKITALRQLCAHGSTPMDLPRPERLKDERLIAICDELVIRGEKALVFASFTASIDSIAQALAERYPGCFIGTIDGRMSPRHRQQSIDDFSQFAGPGILVMNPRAAGVGLNIQAASYVIHYTPEWNPAVVSQASGRSYRRGQSKPVFIYYLYYVGTVEEVMMERLDQKRALFNAGTSALSELADPADIAAALAISPSGQRR